MSNFSGSITYGKEKIFFDVFYVDRKTMEIAVHPDARVIVKAPKGADPEIIRARIVKRARWIRKTIDYFGKFDPRTPSRRYVGGETHLFLGRQYRLKIKKQNDEDVKLKGAYFYVMTPNPDNTQKVKELLDAWYKEHARTVFSRRLEECYIRARKLNVPFPNIRLRKMSKRWGSCSRSGDILLNTALVKASVYCIDYVIMHELCHLKVHTHNNGYFKLLSKYMPDWERRKERLEKVFI
ncbi:MAG: SprT family zinc-dependent metalloprotease [Deltaproteobacteria bacterium]|nr:SprT family zinc-dependent metalloprotease [Deltaproteobacteria bacterium]